jgi:succinate dehydrogenase/fumarate reductase flavoprotein subunit
MEKNLDRRTFLTGAGILAAAGVAGAVTGCTPSIPNTDTSGGGSETPSGNTTSTAASGVGSGDMPYPWDATPPTIAESDIEEEITADVVVVGVGISGTCAVRAAAEEGAQVVFFDKATGVTSSSGDMAVINGNVQARWGRDGVFDIDMVADHEMDECSYFPKRAIWRKWAEHGHEVFDWYISAIPDIYICTDSADAAEGQENWIRPNFYPPPKNYNWEEETHPTFMTSVRLSQETVNPACVQIATDQYGAVGYFEHAVRQLIKEGNRITGCYAYNYSTGKYKKVIAGKGVILACGDYSSNQEMNAYFLPDMYKNGVTSMYSTMDPEGLMANQGDGLKMGDWVGAQIQKHHAPTIHHMGQGWTDPNTSSGDSDMSSMMMNICPLGTSPFLRLNSLGKRFMCEDAPGQQVENQIEEQPGQKAYQFWDANWGQAIEWNPVAHGVPVEYVADDVEVGAFGMQVNQASVDSAVESGGVKKVDTIEALLDMLDIDKATALASIERYNELCHKGKDEDFGKKATRMWPIETAPFYAFCLGLAPNLANMSGLESDEDCHTYDADRNIIPGLYVAGNMQGNRYAVQYPIAMEGAASGMCMYYGYVAGKNVVAGV